MAALAAELTEGEASREVALVQFGAPDDTLEVGGGIEAMATFLDALHHLETAVEASGVPVFARSRIDEDPGRLLGLLADESVADTILVPEDPSYTPPGGSQSPAAPTARLSLNGATSTDGEVVVVLHGGGDDIHALDLGLRLAASRGAPLHVTGSPGRRVGASLARLRSEGLVDETAPAVAGLDIHAGEVLSGPAAGPTLRGPAAVATMAWSASSPSSTASADPPPPRRSDPHADGPAGVPYHPATRWPRRADEEPRMSKTDSVSLPYEEIAAAMEAAQAPGDLTDQLIATTSGPTRWSPTPASRSSTSRSSPSEGVSASFELVDYLRQAGMPATS